MAAGGFLLGLSQGFNQAQQRSFARQQFEAQQAERQQRMAQIEQSNQLRRQERQMLSKQREQSAFLQGLKAYSGIKDPTIKSQMYNKLLMPYINKDMMENNANYGGQPTFMPEANASDFENPSNPIDKGLKDLNSIYTNKNFDRADRLAQAIPIINRIGTSVEFHPRVQKDLMARKQKISETSNWFLMNQTKILSKDQNISTEASNRLTELKNMKNDHDAMAAVKTIAENMAKANETMRVEEAKRAETLRKEGVSREEAMRKETVRKEERAENLRQRRLDREARIQAGRVAEQEKSENESISEYEQRALDYKKLERDYKYVGKLLQENRGKVLNISGKLYGAASTIWDQIATLGRRRKTWNEQEGVQESDINKVAAKRSRLEAALISLAYKRARQLEGPGARLTDNDFKRALESIAGKGENTYSMLQTMGAGLQQAHEELQDLRQMKAARLGKKANKLAPMRKFDWITDIAPISPPATQPDAPVGGQVIPAVATQTLPPAPAQPQRPPIQMREVSQVPSMPSPPVAQEMRGVAPVPPAPQAPQAATPPAQTAQTRTMMIWSPQDRRFYDVEQRFNPQTNQWENVKVHR